MYEVINDEYGIKACGLADLTMEHVQHFLGQWEDGAEIGSLTLFFERGTGDLVLNKDNELYDSYRDLAEEYMSSSAECRSEIQKACPNPKLKETLRVMENCLKSRRIEKELFRAVNSEIHSRISMVTLKEITRRYEGEIMASVAFQYGVMQGKRIERVKKKRQSTNA